MSTSSTRTARRSSRSAQRHDNLVVLDADLASDCRVRAFELAFPERFLECGIAEQDMVSTAAGLARHGFLPVVNSFAAFLASRANEQIYNQASEGTKVVYALHYAGLIPAGPGKSHQSIRDVSLLAALPNMTIVQPANGEETGVLLRWAIEEAQGNVAIRLAIGPSPRRIELAGALEPRRGRVLRDGSDAILFAYGPVMLHEALLASELLAEHRSRPCGRQHAVAQRRRRATGSPTLVEPYRHVLVLEDHAPVGALGRHADARRSADGSLTVLGVEGWPACGTPYEALRHHGLDGASLANRVTSMARVSRSVTRRRVWIVLPDLLSIRVFFDTGIVDGLRERLGRRRHRRLPRPAGGRRRHGRAVWAMRPRSRGRSLRRARVGSMSV